MISENILTLDGFMPRQNIAGYSNNLDINIKKLMLDLGIDSQEEFDALTQKESVASRMIGYRYITPDLMDEVSSAVGEWLANNVRSGKWMYSPLIYPRVCKPGFSVIENKASLYTEPHYDKVDGLNPFWGVWLPLEIVDEESGGLCYFDLPEDLRNSYFPKNKKNYTFSSYVKDHEEIDNLISTYLIKIKLNPGDVVLFNENCLHGATKPSTRSRKSINFQMIHQDVVSTFSEFERLKVIYTNQYLSVCNFINLYYLGDVKYVNENKAIMSKINLKDQILGEELENILNSKSSSIYPAKDRLREVYPWNIEFHWLRKYLTSAAH